MLTKTGYQLNRELQKSKTIKIHFLLTSQDNARRWGLVRVSDVTLIPGPIWSFSLVAPLSFKASESSTAYLHLAADSEEKVSRRSCGIFYGLASVVGRILRCSR